MHNSQVRLNFLVCGKLSALIHLLLQSHMPPLIDLLRPQLRLHIRSSVSLSMSIGILNREAPRSSLAEIAVLRHGLIPQP